MNTINGRFRRAHSLGQHSMPTLEVLIFLLMFAAPAQAFIVDVQFVDETLVASRAVEFEAEYWGCGPPWPNVDGLEFEIRRDESVIDFYYSTQVFPCGVPPQGPVVTYSLGLLPEGDYTLRHVRVAHTQSFPPSMDGLDPVIVPFSVGPAVAEPIPVLNVRSLMLLALLLAGFAVFRGRS